MENIHLLGTSHIAVESINAIKKYILEEKPDMVAVELDLPRAAALFEEKRRIRFRDMAKIGFRGVAFAKIGQYVQEKLGKSVGVAPGSEMKTAIEMARKQHLEVAFIDQPIQITLRNFSKELSWKERFRFFWDMLKGLLFPKKAMKELGLDTMDLRKVPSNHLIEQMVTQLRKRYPSVYKTLVEDRNKYMVRQLITLQKEHPEKKILVVVGAGHEKGMKEMLRKIEVVR
ncbi:TraB/GumN family protein [Candidatus Woesearchaeota archaeon]|nr:TraB/GumN family protein [Candidatus Woesearchaeota archaeon]